MPPVDLQRLERISMRLPDTRSHSSSFQKAKRILDGLLYASFAASQAQKLDAPGLEARRRIVDYGAKTLLQPSSPLPFAFRLYLILFPMDSTRYFEFEYTLKALIKERVKKYLDISSPRLLPCMLMESWKQTSGFILNPDSQDLQQTQQLFEAIGIANQCAFYQKTIEEAGFEAETFDVITSISVIEHIRDDKAAIESLWRLLKPGGKLILTVPCAARAAYQSSNVNHYGLVQLDELGEYFVEYLYDQKLLEERIFTVTDKPKNIEIYGEKQAGFLRAHLFSREARQDYPYWREPLTMVENFQKFDSIYELPGEGVIAMTFIKHV